MGCTGNFEADAARARHVERKRQKRQSRGVGTVHRPIVLDAEAEEEEEEDDPSDPAHARLSELIALAEAGLQAEETNDEDDPAYRRLCELIDLAEAGLKEGEAEDDFFSQSLGEIDDAEAAYHRKKAEDESSKSKDVVVEDWDSDY